MAMIYRHGPMRSALLGGIIVFLSGGGTILSLSPKVAYGELSITVIYMIGAVTLIIGGALFIVAFARYRFTHLWKSTGARHSDKYSRPGSAGKKGRKRKR